ncbi:MAG: carboxypeptidase-like regulatory domain-containing protein [Kineosporiaceae bacterium]
MKRRQFVVLSTVLALAGALSAGTAHAAGVRPGGVAAEEAISFTGRVVDRFHRPLPGVCPRLHQGRTAELVAGVEPRCSDGEGDWAIEGVLPGDYSVELAGVGAYEGRFFPGVTSVDDADLYTVDPGSAGWWFGTRTLPAITVLWGRITDTHGQAVPGAAVTVAVPEAGGALRALGSATSDATGAYRIAGVPEGDAVVQVVPPHPSAGAAGLAWRGRGRAADPASATPLAFVAGRVTTLDLALRPAVVLSVTLASLPAGVSGAGLVLDPVGALGTPIGWGATVTTAGVPVAVTGFPAGTVRLRARWTDAASGQGREAWFGGTSAGTATPVLVSATKPNAVRVSFG